MNAALLSGFLPWLLAASLRASLAALLILALQRLLSRHLPARWRFGLWVPFVLILLLPVVPGSPLSLERLWPEAPAARTSDPAAEGADSAAAAPAGAGAGVGSFVKVSHSSETSGAATRWTAWQIGGLAWLTGFAGVAGIGWLAYRREMERIRGGAVPVAPALRQRLVRAASASGLKRLPQIICSTAVESPAVTGAWQPSLLLPADFPEELSEREADLILRHEALHLRHRDAAWDLLFWLLNAAHWFNPVIWFAFVRLRADRETARDAEVLAEAGQEDRAAYGGALLRLQLPAGAPLFQVGFVGLVNGGNGIRRRIAGLAGHRRVSKGWHLAGVALAVLIQLTVGSSAAPKAPAPPAAKTQTSGNASVDLAKALVLDKVEFTNTSLDDVVSDVLKRGREADAKSTTGRKWFDVMLSHTAKSQSASLSMSLRNTTAYDALSAVADMAGLQVGPDISGDGIRIAEAGSKEFAAGAPAPNNAAVAKARTLMLSRVMFKDAYIDEVVAYIRQKGIEADTRESDPAKKGVNIILIDATAKPRRTITLDMRDVTVYDLLTAAAEMTGLRAGPAAGADAIMIAPVERFQSKSDGAFPANSAELSSISLQASKLVLPAVQFESATAEQVAQYLQRTSLSRDPARKGIKIVVTPEAKAANPRPVTLQLRNTTVLSALRAAAELAGLAVEDDGTSLKLVPKK
jgi:beta-lactamase regulating signal transducer with metallopeptidase domain